jgi:asparagine synthase (glutamine-hydrolysing)
MVSAIRHRGPDDSGVYVDRQTGLGHARLSIIDLAGGIQPMSTIDQKLWITFNGEIFNYIELREELIQKGHRFATRSDTEVILHLYREMGERCVEKLNGQWAFAIWDAPNQKLFLSRDRAGIRPLFYTQTDSGLFLFASEIKALLAHPDVPASLDFNGLDQIFTFWVTVPPRTAFRNISQLPPGHSMVVAAGKVRVSQYWSLEPQPVAECGDSGCVNRLAEDLHNLLLDSTRLQLRSDVPVGGYLSGGLDSTYINALIKSTVGDRLRTFSVSFHDAEFDESGYQHRASRYLDTQHTEVRCSGPDIARAFSDVVWHAEQPILRTAPAPMYLLSKLVREQGYKVVLTGEGADEVLGGYDIYKETKIRSFWGRHLDSKWRPQLLKRLYPYMEGIQRQPASYLKRFFYVDEQALSNPFFSHLPRWELTSKIKAFFSSEVRSQLASSEPLREIEQALPRCYRSWGVFSQAEYLETSYLLPGYILSSQGDRMAMANSIEGRYPFLDHRVLEFASKLSPTLKMKVLNQKYLLKKAAEGLVPDEIRNRHKQPYRAPDGKSFFGDRENETIALLDPERVRKNGVFDPVAVGKLVQKFRSGRETSVKDNMALVGILSTEILQDRFMSEAGKAS